MIYKHTPHWRQKGRGCMKHWKKHISILLILALLAGLLSGCSLLDRLRGEPASTGISETLPSPIETLVLNAVTACRNMDVETLLDYVDPTLAGPARSALSLVQTLGGSVEDMLAAVFSTVLDGEAPEHLTEFCQSLSVTVESVEENGSDATATASYSVSDYSGTVYIHCVNRDGKWYISSVTA